MLLVQLLHRVKTFTNTLLRLLTIRMLVTSIQTKTSQTTVPTKKSSQSTQFLKLRKKMVSLSDTIETLLRLLEVFLLNQNNLNAIG